MSATTTRETPNANAAIRRIGFRLGLLIAVLALAVYFLPGMERWHSKGPANTGHEALGCVDCHLPALGTMRQQLQAKVQFWLGNRQSDVAVGHKPVGNKDCLACHARAADAHPVDRFAEPRFAAARQALGAATCAGCHLEHTGRRVTMAAAGCIHCHDDLVLKNDPVDTSHADLVKTGRWETCLGCHDFHGNFKRQEQTKLKDAYSPAVIETYLAGGASPYGNDRRFQARKQRP